MYSPYDAFAWFYERYWAVPFQEWQTPALERLLFPGLESGARVLDLCCGTGELARRLSACGYKVTGIDSSEEMLRVARAKTVGCTFLQGDAADFRVPRVVDAAVCAFDSINHMLETERVAGAFASVHAALKPGGHFVFDVNTGAAYGEHWNQSACEAAEDHAFFLRGGYDREARVGTTKITMFRLFDSWQRADVEMRQRPLEVEQVTQLLRAAGFSEVSSYRPEELGMNGHYGEGRVYFRACRS